MSFPKDFYKQICIGLSKLMSPESVFCADFSVCRTGLCLDQTKLRLWEEEVWFWMKVNMRMLI